MKKTKVIETGQVVQASWGLPCCSQISPFYQLHWHKYHIPELAARSQDWSHFTAHFIPMVEEYWQKTPFYPAPFSCHAGGNAYEWPGKPKSSNAQPSCSRNLLLAQVKAQLWGTVVVGIVGMHCWGTAGAREGCRRGRWWVLWDGAGWVPPCGTQSCCALGTCVFSSCFPVCSPMELEPELGEKARTQGKAGKLNIYLWSALWFFFFHLDAAVWCCSWAGWGQVRGMWPGKAFLQPSLHESFTRTLGFWQTVMRNSKPEMMSWHPLGSYCW